MPLASCVMCTYTCTSLRGYKTIHVIMLHALLANVFQIAFSANTRCLKI